MSDLDGFDGQLEVAHQRLDDAAAQEIVGVQLDAAEYRQHALVEAVVVLVERAHVLAVAGPDLADGGNAESHQVGFGMRRIALKIAMQTALALRHGQFIVRLGEVVHADEDISRVGQPANRQLQDLQARIGRGQIGFVDAALGLCQGRQVGIVVDRQTVRIELEHFVQRVVEADDVLLGQTVDQIHRDALEAELARRIDHQFGLFEALHAIHGHLHLG